MGRKARRPMTDQEPVKLGIIGCGNISPQYFQGCRHYRNIAVVACADIDPAAARQRAAEFGVPLPQSVDEIFANPEVEIIVNLTSPPYHAPLNLRALEAGKHAYCEKPFATTREEGKAVLELARQRGLAVGCAPDTFLAGPMQTARAAVQAGAIGSPAAATAFCVSSGHESWHPNPSFYYRKGGGPLLDMGPYYLTALVSLLGPIRSVSASAKAIFSERLITSEPLSGARIEVETPTHYDGLLEFQAGASATVGFSFDVKGRHDLPGLRVFGTEGSLALPDPNRFDGTASIGKKPDAQWEALPLQHHYLGRRSLGLSDMADAIRSNRPLRASGALAYHILDAMAAFEESSERGERIELESSCEMPAALRSTTEAQPDLRV